MFLVMLPSGSVWRVRLPRGSYSNHSVLPRASVRVRTSPLSQVDDSTDPSARSTRTTLPWAL